MQEIERRIIDTAVEAFGQHGYDNVSVNEICRLSGITKKTFYYHFKSKDEILFNIYSDLDADMSDVAIDLMKLPNFTERLWYLFLITITTTEKLGTDVSENLIKSSLTRKKTLLFPNPEKSKEIMGQGTRLAMEVIIQGQQNGEFKKDADPELLLWSFMCALLGTTVTWCAYDGEVDRRGNLRKLFEIIFLNG